MEKLNSKVKIFFLDKDNQWDSVGTGFLKISEEKKFIFITKNEDSNIDKISMKSIENENLILSSSINLKNNYERQGNHIISLKDDIINEEIAISFLEKDFTQIIW